MIDLTMTECRREIIDQIIGNWCNPQYLTLHAGEMTAQELSAVRAVLQVVKFQISESLPCPYRSDGEQARPKEGT